MVQMIASPSRYIQGKGLLKQLASYISTLGTHPILLVDHGISAFVMPSVRTAFQDANMPFEVMEFCGECCMTTIHDVCAYIDYGGGDVLLGIGGGKTLDTAKAAAHFSKKPLAVLPTAASSDAPCSSLSVIYHEDGTLDQYLYLDKSPDMVLVDSEVICHAPARFLAAGIGDALSTYFEARACMQSCATNSFGQRPTHAALALAKACHDTLFTYGTTAMQDVREGYCSTAAEAIIEANIYMSGIGFESGGMAAAHAIAYAFSAVPSNRTYMHGEAVALGTIAQLMLEYRNTPTASALEELQAVKTFCQRIGLPCTLSDLEIVQPSMQELSCIAEAACHADRTMSHMPFVVTVKDVIAVLRELDCEMK